MVSIGPERDINILVADDPAEWVKVFLKDLYSGPLKALVCDRAIPVDLGEELPGGSIRMFLAGSEREGVEFVRRERVDLALVAGDNPRLGGLGLVRRMHILSTELPVIVLGSQGNFRWLREALDVGVRTILPRPVNVSQLVSISIKILGV
jgi:phosphoserine phosphatase RsbU/P